MICLQILRFFLGDLGTYLICAKSLLHQDLFNPLNMIALQLDQAFFHSAATGQLGFEMCTKLLKIDLVRINALDDRHLFSIPTLLYFHCYPLLLLGNLLADTQLRRKATDGTHLRTHLVAVTSAIYQQ